MARKKILYVDEKIHQLIKIRSAKMEESMSKYVAFLVLKAEVEIEKEKEKQQ